MAAIGAVFTIGYVANLLGEDEDRLHDLSIDMFPEDGCLWVYGLGEDGVPAFTQDASTTCARSSPINEPPEKRRLRSRRSSPPCGPHRMLTSNLSFLLNQIRIRARPDNACVKRPKNQSNGPYR